MAVIRTLLVDDHPLFAETVATRLSREPDLDVLPVAASEAQALALIRALAPDVVVLDLMLGSRSGLGVLDDIVTRQPCSRVVVLTAASPTEHAVDAIQRGARAWLPKTVDANHLVRVIRGVFLGESWISPDLLGYILGQLASTRCMAAFSGAVTHNPYAAFTPTW